MFSTIFIFAFVILHVAAEMPPYIHVCGRKNPDLDNCIINSIEDLREKICMGIPELEVPPLEPFVIDSMTISDTNDAKLFLKNSKIMGVCNFVINTFHIELDKLQLNLTVTFPKAYINGTYDIDIRVLVPVAHKGPIYLTMDNIIAKGTLDLKIITRHGERYVYITKINLHLGMKGLKSKFDANESAQLNEIIGTFLGNNEEELIAKIKPSMEKEVSKEILLLANNIVKHFTFDELFPDRA
ncbi:juvenile hormone-binding protein [Solenopsis invicta]|uniref:juvenile hormone-binding protein n=1 Tax=Solenopsis invicta TaxID=13686 RepID=UPI000595B6E0|nr:juvenile hormone-binding protein [Solenopsis invicta]